MGEKTAIKCIISFVLGIIFTTCIWTIAVFPNSGWTILSGVILIIYVVTLAVAGIGYLVN